MKRKKANDMASHRCHWCLDNIYRQPRQQLQQHESHIRRRYLVQRARKSLSPCPSALNSTADHVQLYVPTTAAGGDVGFTSSPTADESTNLFRFYGHLVLVGNSANNELDSYFRAVAVGDQVWQLIWDSSSTEGISVSLSNSKTNGV